MCVGMCAKAVDSNRSSARLWFCRMVERYAYKVSYDAVDSRSFGETREGSVDGRRGCQAVLECGCGLFAVKLSTVASV
jgi:hypothetical protein